MPSSQPFGLTPVDVNTIYITFGAGKPLSYAETGMAVGGMLGHKLTEKIYWPRFLKACSRGLITFQGWDDLSKIRLMRTVVALPRSVDAIRDIQIALGGDYSYYRYFDPYVDYEKNPEKMDRFLKGPMTVESSARQIGRKKLFEQQWKNHQKDPKKYRWF